jgi:hypothetical protein
LTAVKEVKVIQIQLFIGVTVVFPILVGETESYRPGTVGSLWLASTPFVLRLARDLRVFHSWQPLPFLFETAGPLLSCTSTPPKRLVPTLATTLAVPCRP